jgi:hypothetical protein
VVKIHENDFINEDPKLPRMQPDLGLVSVYFS